MGLQVPVDSIGKVRSQYQIEDDMAWEYSDSLPLKVAAAVQEYMSFKAYLVRSHIHTECIQQLCRLSVTNNGRFVEAALSFICGLRTECASKCNVPP